jgi:hypothetical protein
MLLHMVRLAVALEGEICVAVSHQEFFFTKQAANHVEADAETLSQQFGVLLQPSLGLQIIRKKALHFQPKFLRMVHVPAMSQFMQLC